MSLSLIEWINEDKRPNLKTFLRLRLNPITSKALGFASTTQLKEGGDYVFRFNTKEQTNRAAPKKARVTAYIKPSIFIKTPQEIFINCNIVNQMVVGNTSLRLLNFISTTGKLEEAPIMSFTMNTDDFARIEMKSIENIEISLTDNKGNLIGAVDDEENPTVLNLFFVKV